MLSAVFSLVKAVWRPVKKTKDSLGTAIENGVQQRKKQRASIDVELGGGYAEGDVPPLDSKDAVIVAEPDFKAVTCPALSTVATYWSLDVQ